MIVGLVGFVLLILMLIMATLGAVLLARFVLGGGSSAGTRIAAAAIAGPLTLVLPLVGIAISESSARSVPELVAVALVLMGMFCAPGWPVAHFATRRLDRLTQFNPQVFE